LEISLLPGAGLSRPENGIYPLNCNIFRSTYLQISFEELDADFEQSAYGPIIYVTKQTTSGEHTGFSDFQLSEANVCKESTVATSNSSTVCSDIPTTSTPDTPAASSCRLFCVSSLSLLPSISEQALNRIRHSKYGSAKIINAYQHKVQLEKRRHAY
jgi:hypothetical protein